jgi:hypothetical protein
MKVGEKNCGNNIPKKSPINVLQTESWSQLKDRSNKAEL